MAETRPFASYESKWQKHWEDQGVYQASDGPAKRDPGKRGRKAEKFYGLIEFPYPSGDGLHVGHPRSYVAIDVVTRKRRMEGKNVLYPIGWDAFGLPTENYAVKHKIKPQIATAKNIANFERQLKMLGLGFDWSRLVNTTDPAYYKWTQWMFLQFFKSTFDEKKGKGVLVKNPDSPVPSDLQATTYKLQPRLAYKARTTINWCPSCKIGLANEEAAGGVCERCGGIVEKREKAQWMIGITNYAERLLQDLDTVDYLDRIKAQQVNWIGRSEGAYINFTARSTVGAAPEALAKGARPDDDVTFTVRVFTTRPDTLFGATYLVLAPEHEQVAQWVHDGTVTNAREVNAYREAASKTSDLERGAEGREKTGVRLDGIVAINPVNNEEIPVWIADYVLSGYGTGAIMAVPAHDERDFAFAKKHDLPIRQVVTHEGADVFTGEGISMNSDFLNGLATQDAKQKIIAWLEKKKCGGRAVTYKLRDWVFSRQRYWGEPIPIIICETCGYVPVPEKDLPVLLPDVKSYEPTDTGESPLSKIRAWVEVKCPSCGGDAERETDTMPNWAGSSWYFMRYCDPHNNTAFADPKKLEYWMPVDLYNGGMEHTTLHLLYSRFWHKFLWDIGVVPKAIGPEPYKARRSHGLILAEGGEKMSKSKGNVVNPDDIVEKYGADVFRVYELFMGPFDQPVPWDVNGIEGVKRFLDKVWRLFGEGESRVTSYANIETLYHQTVKKVTEDIETLAFNTAVSQLMILTNAYMDAGGVPLAHREGYLKTLAPFAPHMTEELWSRLDQKDSIHRSAWPSYDPKKAVAATFELVIQVNGKVRDKITVPTDISEDEATKKALASEKVQGYLNGKTPKKVMYVKGRLVTIVV